MWRCKVVNFLFKAVPIKIFQGYLIMSHIKTCFACQSRLVNREEARSLLIPQAEVQNGKDFWPNVRHAIGEKQSQKFHVNYIEIENKPVQVFYFKTQEENMFFVWAEKSEEGG